MVFFHFFTRSDAYVAQHPFLSNLAESGPAALGFFFVLSGFVLAHATQTRLPATAPQRNRFWWARFSRLYPAYFLAYVLFLPIAVVKYLLHAPHPQTFAAAALLNLAALQAWTPFALSWNGPSWSLSDESFFYFLFPFVVKPLLRCRQRTLIVFVVLLWLAEMCLTAAHVLDYIPRELWHRWVQYNPLFWTPLFLAGIGLYRAYHVWHRVQPWIVATVGLSSLTVLVVLLATCSDTVRDVLIMGGAAPLLTLLVLVFSHNNNVVSRVLGCRPLFLGGAASYIIYILQAPLWHFYTLLYARLVHRSVASELPHSAFFAYLAVLVFVSYAVQRLYEAPMHRWLSRRFSLRAADRTLVAPDPQTERL